MRNLVLIVITLLQVNTVLSQSLSKDRLTFEAGFDLNQFKMNSLNENYVEAFALKTEPKLLKEGITSGKSFRGNLMYRPLEIFDIGIYGWYQFGQTSKVSRMDTYARFGTEKSQVTSELSLRTEAISFGLSSNIYLSHIMGFGEKDSRFSSGSHLSVELHGGWGYSSVILENQIREHPSTGSYDVFTSRAFQGSTGIKYSYDITRTNLISSIGLRVGYQFFKTGNVEDKLGNEWVVSGENSISLDFSGLYYGVIVGIGK